MNHENDTEGWQRVIRQAAEESRSAPQPVAAPSVSAEATLAAETITHLFGVGHVNDIDFTIQRAINAATEKLRAELRQEKENHEFYRGKVSDYMGAEIKWQESNAALRAELSLLHESHDALAMEREGLRKIRTLSGELLMLAKSWALVWSDRLSPESLRTFKDLEVELLAAMTAQNGRAL